MASTPTKFCPNRDLQCYFFQPSAIAALSATSETGFTVSGSWRQQYDWAVVEWNRDNVFEHPALRNLPDGDLSGLQLSYQEQRTNCIALDSTWYPTVDWPYLRIWADVNGQETIYKIPLSKYATPANGSYTAATAQFQLQGTPTPQDYIELSWLDQHFNYQLTSGDTLEAAIAALANIINATQGAAGVTAAANGAQITLTYTGTPGANGNRIGVYGTVHGQGTETWSPAYCQFGGGVSPPQWQIELKFGNLTDINGISVPTTNVRKVRWTWAADIQPATFQRKEFSVVVSNWTVIGSNLQYSVAGPGSCRIEDDAQQLQYQGSWTTDRGNYSGGSITWTTASAAQVSCSYFAQTGHTLYLGTRRADSCGSVLVQVDGTTPISVDLTLAGEDVLVRIPIAQFSGPGNHRVTLTTTGSAGSYFYFDFLEIAVPSQTLPTFAVSPTLTLATDWDTLHSQALAPERTAWLIYMLGFRGRANHYAGALWFYELLDPGQVNASLTIQFSGAPQFSQYTQITLGSTVLQHQNLIGDTAATVVTCFALLINQGSTAVWAQSNGSELTITARATGSQGNGLTVSVATNSTQFTVQTSGPALAGGVDCTPESPNHIIWRTDLNAMPRLNRAARDWHLSFVSALKSYGIDAAVSFSMELGNGDDSVGTAIAQCYPDGTPAWLNTPSLQTNFGPVSTAYWQQVYLDMANLMAQAGLVPYLQFGEVQWWYFANNAGMPFYDAYTTSTFQSQYGRPMGVITSQNASPASFTQECTFLPTLIGQFTDTIISFVRQTQPNTRFEVLYPPDVNDTPLNQLINFPKKSWTPAKLNCLKTENFSYTFARNLNQALSSIQLPLSLGFSNSQSSHLVGISDYTTPWQKEENMSLGEGLESVVLFALDQFCLIGYALPLGNAAARAVFMGG
ncbi:MAG: hypothetical protein JO099_18080 [Acidobacteriia bacterium]|nr:hypothetical protein [Terriglobia bacterium]